MARCLREESAVFEVFDLCRRISGRAVSAHYRAQIDAAMAADYKVAGFSAEAIPVDRSRLLLDITNATVRIAS